MAVGISRLERFGTVESTQLVVRDWLAGGTPEVCVAVADEQSAGRGRRGRRWQAPRGMGLLVSAGFRPRHLAASEAWRLGAIVSLAMLDAASELLGSGAPALRLKWPNDLVVERGGRLAKLGGVLGEAVSEGSDLASAVVGIGVNADWPASDFPIGLTASMTSLRDLGGDLPVDREALLAAWLRHLTPSYVALQDGRFPTAAWVSLQVTTGSQVEVDLGDGTVNGRAEGVDPASGALLVRTGAEAPLLAILHGEVVRCRVRFVEEAS